MGVLAEWKSLFLGGNFSKIVVLGGGIALHAINIFVGSTLMPSIVKDIGGVDLLAWNTTLYIVASILASVFVAHHPAGLGPRQVYAIGAASFAIGSLLCGTALHMESMLLGRFVQGFGAGILVAISYSMVRALFIESLWPRALALMSVVWGGDFIGTRNRRSHGCRRIMAALFLDTSACGVFSLFHCMVSTA
ncbi:MFS transporter (plasmid) [Agrobacterium tumefaciens]|uniref:MFS transporter n=1 Tax=Agrobacterium tumefaciens TaxID=358 RepID=A0AAP9EA88_AGRTU|nr:MFS transporter [Agrobacterium tumefaciens]NSZ60126.1 MFS transporter [Agrobacterium tumefaciens]QDY97722.1 MFS transporter [Agrobacterium tumefaciens]UXS12846.1 MFS transporter [Agrobacterium tumefaciens]UXS20208.1 MFS transporter [Agrobacterium tumefaciens]UXS27854.1 MFS transporter [Agrobacterium tumefaciens]